MRRVLVENIAGMARRFFPLKRNPVSAERIRDRFQVRLDYFRLTVVFSARLSLEPPTMMV